MRIILIILLLLPVCLIADEATKSEFPAREVRIELLDGSIFYGQEIESEIQDTRIFKSNYGTLTIPENEIKEVFDPSTRYIIFESWNIESMDGKATAEVLVSLPRTLANDVSVPLIESRYQVSIQNVRSASGAELEFDQIKAGPLVLIKIKKGDYERIPEKVFIQFESENAVSKNESGKVVFKRNFTADQDGTALVEVTASDNLKLNQTENEIMKRDDLRKQLPWSVEIEVSATNVE